MGIKVKSATKALVALCSFAIGAVLVLFGSYSFWTDQELKIIQGTGYISVALFAATLLISPLQAILGRNAPWFVKPTFRRSLGLTTAAAGLSHGAFVWVWYYREMPWFVPLLDTFSRYGILALGCLILLWASSFPRVNKRLSLQHWKHLHWLTYIAALLVFGHVLLSPFGSVFWVVVGASVLLAIRIAAGAIKRLRAAPKKALKKVIG